MTTFDATKPIADALEDGCPVRNVRRDGDMFVGEFWTGKRWTKCITGWRLDGSHPCGLGSHCGMNLVNAPAAEPATPDYNRPISINGHPLQYLGLCDTTDPFRHALFCDLYGTFRATDAGQSNNNIGWVVNVPKVAPEVTVRLAVAEHEKCGVAAAMERLGGEWYIAGFGTELRDYWERAGWTIHTARETTIRGGCITF